MINLNRNAKKIVAVDAITSPESIEILEDKVLVQGRLSLGISYVGEDDISYFESFEIAIGGFIEMPGALPGMKACVSSSLAASQSALLSPDRLLFKAVVDWSLLLLDTGMYRLHLQLPEMSLKSFSW